MDDVNKNRITNYLYRYSIENNDETFNKLAQVITKKKNFVYRKTFICLTIVEKFLKIQVV